MQPGTSDKQQKSGLCWKATERSKLKQEEVVTCVRCSRWSRSIKTENWPSELSPRSHVKVCFHFQMQWGSQGCLSFCYWSLGFFFLLSQIMYFVNLFEERSWEILPIFKHTVNISRENYPGVYPFMPSPFTPSSSLSMSSLSTSSKLLP